MRTEQEQSEEEDRTPPPLSHGILAMLGAFGLFQGLIRVVDPFL